MRIYELWICQEHQVVRCCILRLSKHQLSYPHHPTEYAPYPSLPTLPIARLHGTLEHPSLTPQQHENPNDHKRMRQTQYPSPIPIPLDLPQRFRDPRAYRTRRAVPIPVALPVLLYLLRDALRHGGQDALGDRRGLHEVVATRARAQRGCVMVLCHCDSSGCEDCMPCRESKVSRRSRGTIKERSSLRGLED